jgi:hypothetical protein
MKFLDEIGISELNSTEYPNISSMTSEWGGNCYADT